MNCKKCGAKLDSKSNYCPNCGRLINKIDNNNKKLGSDKICMIIFIVIIISFVLLSMLKSDFNFKWLLLIFAIFPFVYDKLKIKFDLVQLLVIIGCVVFLVFIGKNLRKELENKMIVNEIFCINLYENEVLL